jgi:hypothetical protein
MDLEVEADLRRVEGVLKSIGFTRKCKALSGRGRK